MGAAATNTQGQPRWALVTGASAGIGAEFCRQLAADGYSLVLVARRRDRLEDLGAELRAEHGVETRVLALDLADPQTPSEIAQSLEQGGTEIEFLVNNAGYGVPGRLVEVDWETHERFLRVMVNAVCELAWRLLPTMQRRGRGYIVNVASVAGLVPGSEGHTLYGASKAFLVRFSESLALEAGPHGVRVSALCPGFTYSEFHDVTGTRQQVSQLPGYLWLQADDVVRYAIASVRQRPPRVVAIPGRIYRLLVWLAGATPGLGRYLTRRASHRFRKLD